MTPGVRIHGAPCLANASRCHKNRWLWLGFLLMLCSSGATILSLVGHGLLKKLKTHNRGRKLGAVHERASIAAGHRGGVSQGSGQEVGSNGSSPTSTVSGLLMSADCDYVGVAESVAGYLVGGMSQVDCGRQRFRTHPIRRPLPRSASSPVGTK